MTAKEAFEKLCESENLGRNEWWIYWPFFKAGIAYQKKASRPSASTEESADAGKWVPWKPGQEVPSKGNYWLTIVNDGKCDVWHAWWTGADWTTNFTVTAYWSIPLPLPYQASKDNEQKLFSQAKENDNG